MEREHIVGLGQFGGSYCEFLGDLMHPLRVMWSDGDMVIWGVRGCWQICSIGMSKFDHNNASVKQPHSFWLYHLAIFGLDWF